MSTNAAEITEAVQRTLGTGSARVWWTFRVEPPRPGWPDLAHEGVAEFTRRRVRAMASEKIEDDEAPPQVIYAGGTVFHEFAGRYEFWREARRAR